MLAAYVSGHGFGHATRVGEVLRRVRERAPDLPLAVVTSGPEALYRRAVPGPLTFRAVECDVGLAQRDALVIDEAGTAERWRAFEAGQEERVAREASWMREHGVRVVLGDIPPLAFAAAAEAGVPSVALANFSWDWVYRHLSHRQPALHEAADAAAAAYAHATLLLELPFAGDLSAFPRRERIPLVARMPRRTRAQARNALGLEGRPLVLVSFGGIGLPGFDPAVLAAMAGVTFVLSEDGPGERPHNVRVFSAADLERAGLEYVDLVVAADAVLTKPGYGIVSDAIAAGTRILYTDRGDFPEYPILAAGMQEWLPCAYVSHEDIRSGRLAGPLDAVLARTVPPPPPLDGAARAAERLLALAG